MKISISAKLEIPLYDKYDIFWNKMAAIFGNRVLKKNPTKVKLRTALNGPNMSCARISTQEHEVDVLPAARARLPNATEPGKKSGPSRDRCAQPRAARRPLPAS